MQIDYENMPERDECGDGNAPALTAQQEEDVMRFNVHKSGQYKNAQSLNQGLTKYCQRFAIAGCTQELVYKEHGFMIHQYDVVHNLKHKDTGYDVRDFDGFPLKVCDWDMMD